MAVYIECRNVLPGQGCRWKVTAADAEEALARLGNHVQSAHEVEPRGQFAQAARKNLKDAETRSG
jgi:predicted small metal-binding protein